MWLAVVGDVGTSILVTLNGMRLLRKPDVQNQSITFAIEPIYIHQVGINQVKSG